MIIIVISPASTPRVSYSANRLTLGLRIGVAIYSGGQSRYL